MLSLMVEGMMEKGGGRREGGYETQTITPENAQIAKYGTASDSADISLNMQSSVCLSLTPSHCTTSGEDPIETWHGKRLRLDAELRVGPNFF